jgi:hypothetical protein
MSLSFTHEFSHIGFKGTVKIPTGLFINNEWVSPKGDSARTIE